MSPIAPWMRHDRGVGNAVPNWDYTGVSNAVACSVELRATPESIAKENT